VKPCAHCAHEVAPEYGISARTVRAMRNGETWKKMQEREV